MNKNRTLLLAVVVVAAGLGVVASHALAKAKKPPKGKITLKDCSKKQPSVTFDHTKHVKATKNKCVTCHHKVDGKAPKKDKCSACHMKPQGDMGTCQDKSRKKNPLHAQCIGCHKKEKKADAPTKCKDCHKK